MVFWVQDQNITFKTAAAQKICLKCLNDNVLMHIHITMVKSSITPTEAIARPKRLLDEQLIISILLSLGVLLALYIIIL